MKFLVLALVLLNLVLWYGSNKLAEGLQSNNVATGTLPRVGSLKSSDFYGASPSSLDNPGSGIGSEEILVKSCVTVGWFDSFAAAEVLAAKFGSGQLRNYRVQERERELPPLHWVIIPPQPGRIASEQLKVLRRRGVDSYLVAQGENRNAISLGLFESRTAAISVLEEKKRQNLNAVLVNFPRNQLSYALSFEAKPELVKNLVRAAEAGYGNKFEFIEINPCEGVATPGKNP